MVRKRLTTVVVSLVIAVRFFFTASRKMLRGMCTHSQYDFAVTSAAAGWSVRALISPRIVPAPTVARFLVPESPSCLMTSASPLVIRKHVPVHFVLGDEVPALKEGAAAGATCHEVKLFVRHTTEKLYLGEFITDIHTHV